MSQKHCELDMMKSICKTTIREREHFNLFITMDKMNIY